MSLFRTVTRRFPFLVGIFIMVLSAAWTSGAEAQIILTNPELPPESNPPDCANVNSAYGAQSQQPNFPGPIELRHPVYKCFQNVFRQADGSDEVQTFDSVLDAILDFGIEPMFGTLTGPTTTKAFGKVGNTTGTFDTEMLSMSLSGSVGGFDIQIRESPTLPSLGQTVITDLGGGLYQIDSFFDVFMEMSVDGGPWMPQLTPAVHMVLVPITVVPVQFTTWGAIKAMYD
jgi:hypothetical protein